MLMFDVGDAIRRSDLFLAVCDGMGAKNCMRTLRCVLGGTDRKMDGGMEGGGRVYIMDVRILNKEQSCSYMNQTSQLPM
jgi:serine/threonine protein phosphatase PrpC